VSAGALLGFLAEGVWVATALCAAVLVLGVVALLRAPRDKAVEVLAGIAQIVTAIRRRSPASRGRR
jgi:hypothetical protein